MRVTFHFTRVGCPTHTHYIWCIYKRAPCKPQEDNNYCGTRADSGEWERKSRLSSQHHALGVIFEIPSGPACECPLFEPVVSPYVDFISRSLAPATFPFTRTRTKFAIKYISRKYLAKNKETYFCAKFVVGFAFCTQDLLSAYRQQLNLKHCWQQCRIQSCSKIY